jgi:hypothetical protein
LISDALRCTLVKRVTLALEPRHGRGIGVPGADIHAFAVLAGLVRVYHAKALIDALVDRHHRRRAADGREEDQAQDKHRATTDAGAARCLRCHVQVSSLAILQTHDPVGVDWNAS